MNSEKTYTPSDVCKMFGVTKSTLLRWEEPGKFPGGNFPLPRRDAVGERLYNQSHLRIIAEYKKNQLKSQYDRIAEYDLIQAKDIQRQLMSLKAKYLGDATGLYEMLAAGEMPFSDTLHILADYVSENEIEPKDSRVWDLTFELTTLILSSS